jgi:hypothetical protein
VMDWTEAVRCDARISRIGFRATSTFLFFPSSVRRFGCSLRVSFSVGGMLGKSEPTWAPATWDWVPLWSFHPAGGLKRPLSLWEAAPLGAPSQLGSFACCGTWGSNMGVTGLVAILQVFFMGVVW